MNRVDVVVVGSANLDLVARVERIPEPGETLIAGAFDEFPGGKGLNQAVAAARAGAEVAFIASLGDDEPGDRLANVIRDERIVDVHLRRVAAPTGRALISVADDGENSIVVVPGANGALRPLDQLPECGVVLTQLETPVPTMRRALELGRLIGATTVLNPAPVTLLPADVLALVDVCVPNEHEVGPLGGVAALHAAGVGTVIVTRGSAGVTIHRTDAEPQAVPPFAVDPVDTTGAGDAFCGALSARLAAGDTLIDAVRFGAAAGALATTSEGAVPALPRRSAIETLARS